MKRALVLLAALSSVAIACGDDDGTDGAPPAAGDAARETAADGGSVTGSGSEYCTQLASFKASRDDVAELVSSGTATPEQIKTAVTAHQLAFRALLDAAPPDIQGDLGAIIGPTDSYYEALAEVDFDAGSLTTANDAVSEALNQLDGPDYIEATESVDAYGLENCGITIGDWQPAGS